MNYFVTRGDSKVRILICFNFSKKTNISNKNSKGKIAILWNEKNIL